MRRRAAGRAGLRRVDWVRLVVDRDVVRAEVTGTGFRLPVSRPIPLSVAAHLIASGTPSVSHRLDTVRVDTVHMGTVHMDTAS